LKARPAALLLASLMFFASLLGALPEPSGCAEAVEYGDWEKIRAVSFVIPCVDEYGMPTVNPDGTFYPSDMFKVRYLVQVEGDVNFDRVDVDYDRKAFEALDMSGWGGLSGSGTFRVRLGASPGTYAFSVSAWANKTVNSGCSGTITVTYGGAVVNAYYKAWCLLTISVNNAGMGATNPPPGSYWIQAGEAVCIEALPAENHTIDSWLVDGAARPGSPSIAVYMDSPHNVTAVFKYLNQTAEDGVSQQAAQALLQIRVLSAEASAEVAGQPAAGSAASGAAALAGADMPILVIRGFMWQTWFDFFRGDGLPS